MHATLKKTSVQSVKMQIQSCYKSIIYYEHHHHRPRRQANLILQCTLRLAVTAAYPTALCKHSLATLDSSDGLVKKQSLV